VLLSVPISLNWLGVKYGHSCESYGNFPTMLDGLIAAGRKVSCLDDTLQTGCLPYNINECRYVD
jgi:hypothetical protein